MIDQIKKFVERLNAEASADPFFDGCRSPVYTVDLKGRSKKYTRILQDDTCAWGFIELSTGNILKAAGWGTPAKHARGHIETAVYGKHYYWTGPSYLR
jgi:hypothetical protein